MARSRLVISVVAATVAASTLDPFRSAIQPILREMDA
jgi:hypothetical protein